MNPSHRNVKRASSSLYTRASKSMMVWGSLVVGLFLTVWIYHASGISHYLDMLEKVKALEHDIQELEEGNFTLRKDISLVERDPKKLEELARSQLGLVRRNEVVYQLVEPK
ncbi:MAG: septum formation initiator family protein [Nitrospirae bacterium]|nr:septum formation initiator family protein [Nitrospirota bacterium]